jgi:hypothetical protein
VKEVKFKRVCKQFGFLGISSSTGECTRLTRWRLLYDVRKRERGHEGKETAHYSKGNHL